MRVPAAIPLKRLSNYLEQASLPDQDWAVALFRLGISLETLPGIRVFGVAPDFDGWFVCMYLPDVEGGWCAQILRKLLLCAGIDLRSLQVIEEARHFPNQPGSIRYLLDLSPIDAQRLTLELEAIRPRAMAV